MPGEIVSPVCNGVVFFPSSSSKGSRLISLDGSKCSDAVFEALFGTGVHVQKHQHGFNKIILYSGNNFSRLTMIMDLIMKFPPTKIISHHPWGLK
jgi:hypothetical protein